MDWRRHTELQSGIGCSILTHTSLCANNSHWLFECAGAGFGSAIQFLSAEE